ncbi:DUF4395 domain-containing protein [Nocardioides solisilvae]|uniref:DUF4395 domain-containing protein n=1 Tax=Nocardioides solisilvae TaxID=1542435 RepID=UPI000D746B60|nr:DUF4395 domain-containing protein [Nocardioides solisilvae]
MATQIDPRGPRLAATITTVVLAGVLLSAPSTLATVLLTAQAAVFALGVAAGVQHTPYGWFFRAVVRPRLDAPAHTEAAAPPRFAQGVGLAFALVGLVGLVSGLTTLGLVAVGFALAAALLNAATGFCLGCEVYLLLARAGLTGAGARAA